MGDLFGVQLLLILWLQRAFGLNVCINLNAMGIVKT
jgi:hypothetical protein